MTQRGADDLPVLGDVVNSGEVTLDSPVHRDHDVIFNATDADMPWGAACVKIVGPPVFTVAQLRRTAARMQELADVAETWRKTKGFDE